MQPDYDYIIMGSGFGGSVCALRLAEKGYRVLVLEKGKWYRSEDFPKTNWNLRKWLWLPSLRFFGIMKITFFRHVTILSGTGVCGGSLVYASTLPRPKSAFFNTGSWSQLANWESELEPYYQLAEHMLGVAENPHLGPADVALQKLAGHLGCQEDFSRTRVGIFFGPPGQTQDDPYFNGKGPKRSGCIACGSCMTGCRYNAKNSLDKNYLHLALQCGAEIQAEQEVYKVSPLDGADGANGYEVCFRKSTGWFFPKKKRLTCMGVVFAGGVLGTVPLLLRLRQKSLPRLSAKLGHSVRTNNESLLPVTSLQGDADFSEGIAIGSILQTDPHSHLEPVRYGRGSGFWRFSLLPLIGGGGLVQRMKALLNVLVRDSRIISRALTVSDWARHTPILLFMQHLDSTLRLYLNKFGRVNTAQAEGRSPTPFIPQATRLAKLYADLVNGYPFSFFLEPLAGISSTAHILGGAVMGQSPEQGVIDKNNRVFGYQNMFICDGSMISANPGVNPSLTITAISERAMAQVPKKR